MDKLKMQTANKADENFRKLAELFPNAVTETIDENGEVVRAIDKDVLMQEISVKVVDGKEERYQFTWPDKMKSVLLANAPISKTLRPCRAESVNFDTTENLYIEGDNLEVLKLLQETYLGKIKMIYIDPPYNTGNDFVYEDDFAQSTDEYLANSGQFDDEGYRLVPNTESNGRFHTDWLNMIYPRLKLARSLLAEDGVIFISIDDNEVENLRKCCDEAFIGRNFIAQLVWERAFSPKNDARFISNSHDYVLMYAKDITKFVIGRLPRTEEANARYSNPDNDPRGVWMSSDISVKTYNAECDYPITAPSGRVIEPPAGRCWSLSKKAFLERLHDNRIWFGPDGNGVPRIKRFLTLAPLPPQLAPMADGIHMLVQAVFDESVLEHMVENGKQTKVESNELNQNFYKKEFQELWKRINHKYAYTVSFDSSELIEKAICHIDSELFVSELTYTVSKGEQTDEMDVNALDRGEAFQSAKTRTTTLKRSDVSHITYDLVGKIAEGTVLTRRTVVAILKGISPVKFAMYKANPEEFISKVIRLINEQKATMIVEHITYDQIEGEYDSTIFTAEKNAVGIDKAFRATKHIQDYVFTDGYAEKSVERRFAEDLDAADEVCVYAKLPRGFHIPTPVGNYSPDWAIAFNEGAVKHIFFIAETKGTMESLSLKPIEKAKISCARKLFNEISTENVKYHDVDSYQHLLDIMQSL